LEQAEKDGRVTNDVQYDPNFPVIVSSDIGFRDTAAWWFWQPTPKGFNLIDYDDDSGLDASEWIPRLKLKGYKYEKIWLPHDARAKTFQSQHSTIEQFLEAFGAGIVDIVPQTKKKDRIEAARIVLRHCRFNPIKCRIGLAGLRAWSFEWIEDNKTFSKEPRHDWASHPGDGFSYGAQVLKERAVLTRKPEKSIIEVPPLTLNEMWKTAPKADWRI